MIVLRYYADLSEREIATAIRRRPGTVKSRLHEARRRLAADARLAGFGPDAEVTTEVRTMIDETLLHDALAELAATIPLPCRRS